MSGGADDQRDDTPCSDAAARAELRELLATILGRSRVPGDGDFSLPDAGLDSLGMIDLVAGVESAFGIRVAPDDITPENFATLQGLAAFVAGRVGSRA